ncbi:MAG: hypothetical protein OEV66_10450 [Spirochaetia bacterium]|nr:hypothetical protein [Spirochaetia bacterium]
MKKFILALSILASQLIYAGAVKDKFLELSDKLDKQKASIDERTKILEENINRAIKMTLMQQYNLCNAEKAEIGKDGYEVSELNQNLIYIQYQGFVGYYLFASNPTAFIQYPIDSKVLVEADAKIVRSYDSACADSGTAK